MYMEQGSGALAEADGRWQAIVEQLDAEDMPTDVYADPWDIDEGALARRPAYYRQLDEMPLLDAEEEVGLARKMREGDEEAYLTFFHANLKLVLFIANKELHRARYLDIDDLVMEGNLGLMRAMDDFDPEREARFVTMAYKRIRGAVRHAIRDKDRTIRLPSKKEEKLASAALRERELQSEFGRQPTDEEIAERIGLSAEGLVEIKTLAQAALPLEEPFEPAGSPGEPVMASEVVADPQALDPVQELLSAYGEDETGIVTRAIREVLQYYRKEERLVFERYYGLGGEEPKGFEEIGEELGTSREKPRTIHHRIIKQLIPAVIIHMMEQGLVEGAEELVLA